MEGHPRIGAIKRLLERVADIDADVGGMLLPEKLREERKRILKVGCRFEAFDIECVCRLSGRFWVVKFRTRQSLAEHNYSSLVVPPQDDIPREKGLLSTARCFSRNCFSKWLTTLLRTYDSELGWRRDDTTGFELAYEVPLPWQKEITNCIELVRSCCGSVCVEDPSAARLSSTMLKFLKGDAEKNPRLKFLEKRENNAVNLSSRESYAPEKNFFSTSGRQNDERESSRRKYDNRERSRERRRSASVASRRAPPAPPGKQPSVLPNLCIHRQCRDVEERPRCPLIYPRHHPFEISPPLSNEMDSFFSPCHQTAPPPVSSLLADRLCGTVLRALTRPNQYPNTSFPQKKDAWNPNGRRK